MCSTKEVLDTMSWKLKLCCYSGLILAYSLLFISFHPGLWQYLFSGFIGGASEDPGLYIWLIKNNAERVLTLNGDGFDVRIFFPFGKTLGFTDNFLLPGLIAKVFFFFGVGLPLTFNFLFLLCAGLNGYSAFYLARYLGINKTGAFFAGFLFSNAPFFCSQLGHPQLQFAFLLPMLFFLIHRTFETGSLWVALAIGFCFFAAITTSVYYFIFCFILLGLTILSIFLLRPNFSVFLQTLKLFVMNALWFIPCFTILQPYIKVRDVFGARELSWVDRFVITNWSFIASPPHSGLWQDRFSPYSNYEGYFYTGFLAIVLLFTALYYCLWRTRKHPFEGWLMLSIMAVFGAISGLQLIEVMRLTTNLELYRVTTSVLSVVLLVLLVVYLLRQGRSLQAHEPGPYHDIADSVLGVQERRLSLLFVSVSFLILAYGTHAGADMPQNWHYFSPYSWAYYFLPGFDALRVPARLGVVPLLALCVLAGLGLSVLRERFRTGGLLAVNSMTVIFFVVAAIEIYQGELPGSQPIPTPDIYQKIPPAKDRNQVIACLPMGNLAEDSLRYASLQTNYMNWLQPTGWNTPAGYSGVITTWQMRMRTELVSFPNASGLELLAALPGLRFIIYHGSLVNGFRPEVFEKKLQAYSQVLRLVDRDKDNNYLLEFHPWIRSRSFEIAAPPERDHQRRLSFRYRSSGGPEEEGSFVVSMDLGTEKGADGKRRRIGKSIHVSRDQEWREFSAVIPPSSDRVRPHLVRIYVPRENEDDYFELREIKLSIMSE